MVLSSPTGWAKDPQGFWFTDTVRFRDTDAAGVVYFAHVLAFCHNAYEASLLTSGIPLQSYFADHKVGLPITTVSARFRHPLMWGDPYHICLIGQEIAADRFEVSYTLYSPDPTRQIGEATTRHVCIDTLSRTPRSLTPELQAWLEQWGVGT